MNKHLIWLLGAAALVGAGWYLYQAWQKNRRGEKLPQEEPKIEEPEKEPPEKVEEPTGQQKLLQQLTALRKHQAQLQYRQDCAAFFLEISGCIQDWLAQEVRSCSKDSVFCRRLAVAAENESLTYRMESRKQPPQPRPVTEVEATMEEQALEALLEQEDRQYTPAVVDIPWDAVVQALLPFLEGILRWAENADAGKCREGLKQLREILTEQNIQVLWYQDPAVGNNDERYWDFVHTGGYPIPALYYRADDQFIHVGVPGRTGEEIQPETGENYG